MSNVVWWLKSLFYNSIPNLVSLIFTGYINTIIIFCVRLSRVKNILKLNIFISF